MVSLQSLQFAILILSRLSGCGVCAGGTTWSYTTTSMQLFCPPPPPPPKKACSRRTVASTLVQSTSRMAATPHLIILSFQLDADVLGCWGTGVEVELCVLDVGAVCALGGGHCSACEGSSTITRIIASHPQTLHFPHLFLLGTRLAM